MTADAFMEIGQFHTDILSNREDSIIHFEKAFLIYETLYGSQSKECMLAAT